MIIAKVNRLFSHHSKGLVASPKDYEVKKALYQNTDLRIIDRETKGQMVVPLAQLRQINWEEVNKVRPYKSKFQNSSEPVYRLVDFPWRENELHDNPSRIEEEIKVN